MTHLILPIIIIILVVLTGIHIVIRLLLLKFNPKFYVKIGIPVKTKKLYFDKAIQPPVFNIYKNKTVGNFIFENGEVFIYPKLLWSGWYNLKTAYMLRVKGTISKRNVLLSIRLSLLSVLTLFALVISTLVYVVWNITYGPQWEILSFVLLFLLVLTFNNIQAYFFMGKNLASMEKELKEIITMSNTG